MPIRVLMISFYFLNIFYFCASNNYTFTRDSLLEYRPIPYTQKDRDLLIKLDERTQYLEKLINERTDNLQKQIDDLKEEMKWQFGVLFSLIVALFGFIIWDRRTFMKPLEERVISLNEETKNIKEKVQLNERLIQALRELSLKDEKLREVLKQFNLL